MHYRKFRSCLVAATALSGAFVSTAAWADCAAGAGPLATLLDTQGVVLLGAGRTAEAIRVLESSAQGDSAPAARLLHLAEAYQQAGKNEEGKRVLELAEKRGVSGLAPRDRRAYLRLKALL